MIYLVKNSDAKQEYYWREFNFISEFWLIFDVLLFIGNTQEKGLVLYIIFIFHIQSY